MAGKVIKVRTVFDSLDNTMQDNYNIQVDGIQNYLGNTSRSSRHESSSCDVKSRLLSASRSLEAYKQKTQERLSKQENLKKQQQGLNEKTRDFDVQMDEFIENCQQLTNYSTELQQELIGMKKTKDVRGKIRNESEMNEKQERCDNNEIFADLMLIGDGGVMKSEKSVIVEDCENDSSIGNCQKQSQWESQQKQQPSAAAYYKTKMGSYSQENQFKNNLKNERNTTGESQVNYNSNNRIGNSYNGGSNLSNQCTQSMEYPGSQSISQYITVKKRKKIGNEEILSHCASNYSTNNTNIPAGTSSICQGSNTARSNMADMLKEQAEEIEKMETKIKELTGKNQDLKQLVAEKTEELLQKEEAEINAKKNIESLEESVLLKTTEIFNLRERLEKKDKEQEMMKEVIQAQKEEINKLEGDIQLQRTEILVLKSRNYKQKNTKPNGNISTLNRKGLKLDDYHEKGDSASPQTAKKHQVLISPVHKLMPHGVVVAAEDINERISGSVDFHERKLFQQSSSRSILTQPSTQRSVCKNLDSTRQEDQSLMDKQQSYSIQCLGKDLSSYEDNLKKPTQSQIKLLWTSQAMLPNQQNINNEIINNLTSPKIVACRDILNETAAKNRSSSLLSHKQQSHVSQQHYYFHSPLPTAPYQPIQEMNEQPQYQSATQNYSQQINLNIIASNNETNPSNSNSQNYLQINNSQRIPSYLFNQTHTGSNYNTAVPPPRAHSLMNSNKPVINLDENQQQIPQTNSIQKPQLQGIHSPTQQNLSKLLGSYQQQQQQSCVKISQHQSNSINSSVLIAQSTQQQQPVGACI